MKLSVIIPTRNRAASLRRALVSILGQSFSKNDFEVIIVDNGSSDDTQSVASEFINTYANFRYLNADAPGLHEARHMGMNAAKAEFLVFCDDDIGASSGWLEGVWEGFYQYGADLVGGKILPQWEITPPTWLINLWKRGEPDWQALGYLSILDFGNIIKEIDSSYIWGCNFSIRKNLLLEAGGFHPDSMPDDLLHLRGDGESYVARFAASRGYKSVYVPSALVHHFVPQERMTIQYLRKRAFSQGVSDSFSELRRLRKRSPMPAGWELLGRILHVRVIEKILPEVLAMSRFLKWSLQEAYWCGFRWHQTKFDEDEATRNWVLRPDFLES